MSRKDYALFKRICLVSGNNPQYIKREILPMMVKILLEKSRK